MRDATTLMEVAVNAASSVIQEPWCVGNAWIRRWT